MVIGIAVVWQIRRSPDHYFEQLHYIFESQARMSQNLTMENSKPDLVFMHNIIIDRERGRGLCIIEREEECHICMPSLREGNPNGQLK